MSDRPPSENNDEAPKTSLTLLFRASCNIQTAWNKLFHQYSPSIFARCNKTWCLNKDDSENAVQDVFSAISRKLAEFRRARKGSFRKWIRIITDNKCKDTIKQTPVAVAVGGEETRKAIENIADPYAEDATDIDSTPPPKNQDTQSNPVLLTIKTIKRVKTKRDWEIFEAVIMENQPRLEVAKSKDVSLNVVNLVVSRVRKAFKEELLRQININQGWKKYQPSSKESSTDKNA